MLETVLLPFEDKIVYDSFFSSYNVSFGKGIRETLEIDYNNAKNTYGIMTNFF